MKFVERGCGVFLDPRRVFSRKLDGGFFGEGSLRIFGGLPPKKIVGDCLEFGICEGFLGKLWERKVRVEKVFALLRRFERKV